jgi:ribosomal-protein-alanine N-acetyltransferase
MLNLAVNSTQQGHGLGRGLVKKACVDATKNGVVKVLLEVRSNNLIVRQFYESEGFLVFGRRNNYYRSSGQTEDALAMEQVLGPASVMTQ